MYNRENLFATIVATVKNKQAPFLSVVVHLHFYTNRKDVKPQFRKRNNKGSIKYYFKKKSYAQAIALLKIGV